MRIVNDTFKIPFGKCFLRAFNEIIETKSSSLSHIVSHAPNVTHYSEALTVEIFTLDIDDGRYNFSSKNLSTEPISLLR